MGLDLNECETLNGGCEHQCKNTNGSYICECNKGFSLNGNGKTCSGKYISYWNKYWQRDCAIENINRRFSKETFRLNLKK